MVGMETDEATGKARLRSEIVEALQGLNRIGVVGDGELREVVSRVLGSDAVAQVSGSRSPSSVGTRYRGEVPMAVDDP